MIANKLAEYVIISDEMNKKEKEIGFDSPIEEMFYKEWIKNSKTKLNDFPFNIFPQYNDSSTGRYRLDFALLAKQTSLKNQKICIELDGHIWHEKTKEQVSYEKSRERYLVREGWIVLRFSGSEVYKNARRCVSEIVYFCLDQQANET